MEEGKTIYSIFIDFDETLSDNHIDEKEEINEKNFIRLCYNGVKENYNKIKNALNKLDGNYEFYVLSRNENELLKKVIPKLFPGVFKEILLYSDLRNFFQENLKLFSTLKSEYTEGKRSPDETKKFAVIKLELALSKAGCDIIILIDDSDIYIKSFIDVGCIALNFSHRYIQGKKYLDKVLNDIDSNIKKYNEPCSTKHESEKHNFIMEEKTTTPKNVGRGLFDSPDVKPSKLFGSDSDSGKRKSKRKSKRRKKKSKRRKKSKNII